MPNGAEKILHVPFFQFSIFTMGVLQRPRIALQTLDCVTLRNLKHPVSVYQVLSSLQEIQRILLGLIHFINHHKCAY